MSKKNAFHPKTITIGPLHYVSPPRDTMYPLKLSLLQGLLGGKVGEINRSNIDNEIESQSCNMDLLKDLVEAMMELEQQTREYYSETFDISSDEFVNMMAIDGCFVIELLLLHHEVYWGELSVEDSDGVPGYSQIFTTRWLLPNLRRDLIKLENQLPFFVLEKLFSMTSENKPSLPYLCVDFFGPMLLQNKFMRLSESFLSRYPEDGNMVDLIRLEVLGARFPKWFSHSRSRHQKMIYSAQQLQEAGVAFIKKDSDQLNINFNSGKGTLHIPPLYINENATTVLLNILAMEQWTQLLLPFFTNYFLFLDSLIDTTEDVEILSENGILQYPQRTEKEVADFFSHFCKETYDFIDEFLSFDIGDVNNYCKAHLLKKNWRFWLSNLKEEHFSNPWTFLSLLAAIVLLILTLLQTIYTMVSYHHPN